MKNHSLFIFFAILIIISYVESTLSKDFLSEHTKPWYGVVIHRFYGPWNVLRKRNGDYVDYNDYGAHISNFNANLPDSPYDGQSISEGYLHEASPTYSNAHSLVDSDYGPSPIGLAVFRTGIRTGRITEDDEESDDTGLKKIDNTTPIIEEG